MYTSIHICIYTYILYIYTLIHIYIYTHIYFYIFASGLARPDPPLEAPGLGPSLWAGLLEGGQGGQKNSLNSLKDSMNGDKNSMNCNKNSMNSNMQRKPC